MNRWSAAVLIVWGSFGASLAAAPLGTAITYQGQLKQDGIPVDGTANFVFRLFDAETGGTQVGSSAVRNGVAVVNGLFTVELDFGIEVFDGSARWLQTSVNGVPLSPRQSLMPTPYAVTASTALGPWENEGDDLFYTAGRVGIGTSAPSAPLDVKYLSQVGNVGAIVGEISNTAPGAFSAGVRGINRGTSGYGIGVYGSQDGSGWGVYGTTVGGRGVYGVATASSGATTGVWGQSSSTEGRGVSGEASASSGEAYGGRFESNSMSGRGVFGLATATSGAAFGVFGQSNSGSGRGVSGLATASTGNAYGGFFETASTAGRAVFGLATASSGVTYGVWGHSNSMEGIGVYGLTLASSGPTHGGLFESLSSSGRGVVGLAAATSGFTYGVYGKSDSPSGRGVFGWASGNSGITYGVYGKSDSPSGRGVFGWASGDNGINYGVHGVSSSPDGYAGYFDGRGYFYNLGVGVVDPFYKLELPNIADSSGRGRANRWDTYSSVRWKDNIHPISDALGKLLRLTGVEFDWKAAHGGTHDIGFVAEEVGKVLPEAVSWDDDGRHAMGMAYDRVTPVLVEAVKELEGKVRAQDAEMASKGQEVTRLQERLRHVEETLTRLTKNEGGM